MRHLGRTHGISITWLHDETSKPTIDLQYIDTTEMVANIMTNFFPTRKILIWIGVCNLINVIDQSLINASIGTPGGGWTARHPNNGHVAVVRKTYQIAAATSTDIFARN